MTKLDYKKVLNLDKYRSFGFYGHNILNITYWKSNNHVEINTQDIHKIYTLFAITPYTKIWFSNYKSPHMNQDFFPFLYE